jgi:hypothetical protein
MNRLDAAWNGDDWPTALRLLDQLQTQAPDALNYKDKLYVAHFNQAESLLGKGDKTGAAKEFTAASSVDASRSEAQAQILALTPTPVPRHRRQSRSTRSPR